jgi:flagellar protein FliS
MFGLNQYGINAYTKVGLEAGVHAASPHKLIIMLYEGVIAACHSAIGHMQNKDIEKKGAMFSKAILIIENGLRLSLDKKAGGEIAENLDALYAYMSTRLTMANIRNKPELVHEVIKLLTELKTAWETIGSSQDAVSEMPNIIPRQVAVAVNRNIAHYTKG